MVQEFEAAIASGVLGRHIGGTPNIPNAVVRDVTAPLRVGAKLIQNLFLPSSGHQ